MKAKPGTYALVLKSRTTASAQIGRWGCLDIEPGYYIYVGSAFGPGGVQARVARHCRNTKPGHWHIDYLREQSEPVLAWSSYDPGHLEHRWAKALSEMNNASSVKGFGCSDCKCQAHLFVLRTRPTLAQFIDAVGGPVWEEHF